MTALYDAEAFRKLPVVGILRGFAAAEAERLVKASVEGGLRNIEVTMNSPGAADQIRRVREVAGPGVNVGAGTVVTLASLEEALRAGAGFIVTPALLPDVVRACVERKIPVFPGAMTPTEILQAWQLGATMVKVFPADRLGPEFIKAVKAPFPEIPLMPTGGVTVETLGAFKKAGAGAFGVGTPLFDKKQASAENWGWFRQQAARFVEAYAQA
ncbi:MAG: bifunctional 4-hydroxy-2-oxoglutarate aldolase/2-dehydro-3-deoxy-phosphogluconate aldolase [Gemmatimonadales bacterium]